MSFFSHVKKSEENIQITFYNSKANTQFWFLLFIQGELEIRERAGKIYHFGKPIVGESRLVLEVMFHLKNTAQYTSYTPLSFLSWAKYCPVYSTTTQTE